MSGGVHGWQPFPSLMEYVFTVQGMHVSPNTGSNCEPAGHTQAEPTVAGTNPEQHEQDISRGGGTSGALIGSPGTSSVVQFKHS